MQDFLLKEFEHPIDYDLDAALPRLQTWGLIKKNHQVGLCCCSALSTVMLATVIFTYMQPKSKPTPYTPHSAWAATGSWPLGYYSLCTHPGVFVASYRSISEPKPPGCFHV